MKNVYQIIFAFLLSLSFSAFGEAGVVAFSLGESNVKKGEPILVGQTIFTGKNGHVHIKFIDGALISLRPNSRMKVEAYTYDPDNPANNRVKFFIEKGVVRSVTGEAGKTNKKGFRMNTPTSAIGIRGTDYTVHVQESSTRVFVKSGGIGLSPINDECKKEGFGVCQTKELVELFAGDDYILEISSKDQQIRSYKFSELNNSPSLSVSSEIGNSVFTQEKWSSPPVFNNQTEDIAWANWSNFETILNQYFTPMTPFFNDQWRIYTKNSMYGLFIKNEYPTLPKIGLLNYELNRYQAFSLKNQVYQPMLINDAELSIHFDDRTFSFKINLSNSDITTSINQQGTINRIGGLSSNIAGSTVSGAINGDLEQVGIIFEKQVDASSSVVGGSAWIKK